MELETSSAALWDADVMNAGRVSGVIEISIRERPCRLAVRWF